MWGVRRAVLVWPSEAFVFEVISVGLAGSVPCMGDPSTPAALVHSMSRPQPVRLKPDQGWNAGFGKGS